MNKIMKENEAPEKIYLQVCGDCTLNDKETCEQCCKDNPINNGREVTWCVDKIFDNDVEYTRTDAFIEKVCEWLEKNIAELTGVDSYTITE